MSDVDQLRERAERYAQRAHAAELEVVDLRDKLRRIERDRNALLAQVRELGEALDQATAGGVAAEVS